MEPCVGLWAMECELIATSRCSGAAVAAPGDGQSQARRPLTSVVTAREGHAMAELEWFDCYTGETLEQLIALEGNYRIDSLVLAFEQAMDQKAARVGDRTLSEEERVILAIEALEHEVNNGGYGQFFVNSSEYAPIIVDALRRIGCPRTAEITEKALTIVQRIPITAEEIENGTWDENDERQQLLSECDGLYFEGPENIEESLWAFIKANGDKIKP